MRSSVCFRGLHTGVVCEILSEMAFVRRSVFEQLSRLIFVVRFSSIVVGDLDGKKLLTERSATDEVLVKSSAS